MAPSVEPTIIEAREWLKLHFPDAVMLQVYDSADSYKGIDSRSVVIWLDNYHFYGISLREVLNKVEKKLL